MTERPAVAVVVPVHNTIARTIRFLDSFARVDYPDYQIIVVDDGSTDGTAAILATQFPRVRVLEGDGNLWWAGATNRGVAYALDNGFDYVLTINNDTVVEPRFLSRLVESAAAHPLRLVGSRIQFLERPAVTWAVGARMHWAAGRIFELCHWNADEAEVLQSGRYLEVETLTGCGTLISCACYRQVGLYDARWFPQYHADAEFVLRARGFGYRALVDTQAVVFNEADHTCAGRVSGWRAMVLSRGSAGYWRALVAAHWRYCPWWLWMISAPAFYIRLLAQRSRGARRVYQSVRRALGRAA